MMRLHQHTILPLLVAAAKLKSGPRINKDEILRKLEQIRREHREKGDSH
jgi:hypothetical protein